MMYYHAIVNGPRSFYAVAIDIFIATFPVVVVVVDDVSVVV